MRWHRWTCPKGDFVTLHDGRAATRESSFVDAITAAGVTFAITKSCSQGLLEGCSCSEGGSRADHDWKWRGCSDDVDFGSRAAEHFLGTLEEAQDAQALVSRHNDYIGRMAVEQSARRLCKCHGVSGACTTKTCWRQLQPFTTVAEALERKYRRAVKIKDTNALLEHTSITRVQTLRGRALHRDKAQQRGSLAQSRRLVYLNDSPDFCHTNSTVSWPSTVGRRCSRKKGEGVTAAERRSCKTLCRDCSLSVNRNVSKVVAPCHCRFQWCCEVKCDNCLKRKVTFSCSERRSQ
ncbi:protein Wnt-8b-like [Eriocheir sinensis]|uniref:protein Wnt-8b-like n=1 Tax=Eriocheir sinensis TaxID=95602 RepID=UPI0021C59EB9|nr:protein Wnt-8b-like [Eriocheir sinensis]